MTSATTTKRKMTAEEFWQLCADGKPRELVRGEVVEQNYKGLLHGSTVVTLAAYLSNFIRDAETPLGIVLLNVGYVVRYADCESVRAVDVSFIRRERLPAELPEAFPDFAPDLAIEVVEPNDRYSEVAERIEELLQAGAGVYWVVDLQRRKVDVYHPNGLLHKVHESEVLTCEDLLPGFELPLKTLFGRWQKSIEGADVSE